MGLTPAAIDAILQAIPLGATVRPPLSSSSKARSIGLTQVKAHSCTTLCTCQPASGPEPCTACLNSSCLACPSSQPRHTLVQTHMPTSRSAGGGRDAPAASAPEPWQQGAHVAPGLPCSECAGAALGSAAGLSAQAAFGAPAWGCPTQTCSSCAASELLIWQSLHVCQRAWGRVVGQLRGEGKGQLAVQPDRVLSCSLALSGLRISPPGLVRVHHADISCTVIVRPHPS